MLFNIPGFSQTPLTKKPSPRGPSRINLHHALRLFSSETNGVRKQWNMGMRKHVVCPGGASSTGNLQSRLFGTHPNRHYPREREPPPPPQKKTKNGRCLSFAMLRYSQRNGAAFLNGESASTTNGSVFSDFLRFLRVLVFCVFSHPLLGSNQKTEFK